VSEYRPPVLHRAPRSCPMCGGYTVYPGRMCAYCSKRANEDDEKIKRLMGEGHTYHCAARHVWGDGGCEGCIAARPAPAKEQK
jgi:hypothetical protein